MRTNLIKAGDEHLEKARTYLLGYARESSLVKETRGLNTLAMHAKAEDQRKNGLGIFNRSTASRPAVGS